VIEGHVAQRFCRSGGDARVRAGVDRGRARRHPDEGRDAQPPDRDLAVPRRRDRLGRRDPRRGRDRPRREAQGRPDGFTVSNLRIPASPQPWEAPESAPPRIASALEIMLDGPLGAARSTTSSAGRRIAGYFRTFEQRVAGDRRRHARLPQADHDRRRPRQRPRRSTSRRRRPGRAKLVVLGGPAMLIGLGGGAASSIGSGASARGARLRVGAARQPRDAAARAGSHRPLLGARRRNPIVLIHDVGAGGLSNAMPELVDDSGAARGSTCARSRTTSRACRRWRSGATRRRSATCSRRSAERLAGFDALCARERCPYAVIGEHRRRRADVAGSAVGGNRRRSTCRSTCCSASRRR
jgi:phosphoribosylformylglycinamidine synthase